MTEQGTFISNKYKNSLDKFAMIVEKAEEVEKLKKSNKEYIKYIHCNGCFRKCALSNANCGRGKNLKDKF